MPDHEVMVGQAALNQQARNTKNTIYDLQKIIGQPYSNLDVEKWPFRIEEEEQGGAIFILDAEGRRGEILAPVEVLAQIFE